MRTAKSGKKGFNSVDDPHLKFDFFPLNDVENHIKNLSTTYFLFDQEGLVQRSEKIFNYLLTQISYIFGFLLLFSLLLNFRIIPEIDKNSKN